MLDGRPGNDTFRMAPPSPVAPSRWDFPDPSEADSDGLVGFGGDLDPGTLVGAYRHGIFPWPHEGVPLPWFSPDPRAVIELDGVRVSRSLRQRLRRSGWHTTVDAAFGEVIASCANPRRDGGGTWIHAGMQQAYRRLNSLGWAHSVEVWSGDELVGGLYGVLVGGCFTGESMFHRRADASKVALVDLAARMAEAGAAFIDVQLPTAHLESMGAHPVPRRDYLARLAAAVGLDARLPVDRRPVYRLAGDAPGRPL